VRITTNDPRQKGTAIVEAAVLILLFMVLFVGIIEGGRMLWTYNTLTFAAREGTRYAAVRGAKSSTPATADTVQTYVMGRATGLDATKMTVSTTWSPDNIPGHFVQVVVDYQYSTITKLFLRSSFQLSSTSRTAVLH